uniref:Arsenical-resistance protein n=1 Tax=Globisporangium ultimum (strain ATCC 200006 / CBS 805.95 / DAOM BR144) TaxID=431595 RepID=K3WXY5_GLOUD
MRAMLDENSDVEASHAAPANGDKDSASPAAALSALDRFLPLWILLSAGAGLGLGQLSAVHSFIESTTVGSMNVLVGLGLLAMMYPPLANVRWQLVHKVFTNDWRMLVVTTFQNWVIGPLLMFALSAAFFHDDPGFMAGFSLVGCSRCIGMVMIWISLAGGDIEYGAALIAVNSVWTMALYSLYAGLLLNELPSVLGLPSQDEVHITVAEIATNVGIYMGVPFALAIAGWVLLIRWKGAQWYFDEYAPRLDALALVALLFTIVVLFASQSQRLTTTFGSVLVSMVPFLIYLSIMFTSTFALSKLVNASYAQSVTQAFTATSNNYELSLGVAVATFGLDSDPAMMSVVAALIEIPSMLVLVHLSFWCKRRFFMHQASNPKSTSVFDAVLRSRSGFASLVSP